MKLIFKGEVLGSIINITRENSLQYGILKANGNYRKYIDFFNNLVCEDGFDESKFDDELLNDANWSVICDKDEFGIYIPAIYNNEDIEFRYR